MNEFNGQAPPECQTTGAAQQQEVFILSPCTLAGIGLEALLATGNCPVRHIPVGSEAHETALQDLPLPQLTDRLIVYLPDDPAPMLNTLNQLVTLLELNYAPLDVVLLINAPVAWLYRTLLRMGFRRGALSTIRVLNNSVSWAQLHGVLVENRDCCTLARQALEEEKLTGKGAHGLTRREYDAVVDLFNGRSFSEQQQLRGVQTKTLYNQRRAGLRKLITQLPALAKQIHVRKFLPQETKAKAQSETRQTTDEHIFRTALRDGLVCPEFEPVIDKERNLLGFEVLLRWHSSDCSEFLTALRSRRSWLTVMAFLLDTAVRIIRHYEGMYYTIINVPDRLLESKSFLRLVSDAATELDARGWTHCLVMAFDEDSSALQSPGVPEIVKTLQIRGIPVILNHCFRNRHVKSPVRNLRFSGFKLDKEITANTSENAYEASLIQTHVFFSELTGGFCIAGGVESAENFNRLVELGVSTFSGSYISKPVPEARLHEITGSAGKKNYSMLPKK